MVAILKKGASKKSIRKLLDKIAKDLPSRGIDAQKYCGLIQLKEDSLIIQKRLRDEWE